MLLPLVLSVFLLCVPVYSQNGCCRLPFTDTECQVNRNGPHRYQRMPNQDSGLVMESTECYVNDYNSTYRKVSDVANDCNDCPGLLILHTKSSEIFLYPEYLERILQDKTAIQRKNVVILTTNLTGAYDVDFTFFARYYASHALERVPSLYVDLQMPVFDPKQNEQPKLRLRIPDYIDDKEGASKISRRDLMQPSSDDTQITANAHQLPYLYHFDMAKHRHPPTRCTLYDIELSPSLKWIRVDSAETTCHRSEAYFGHNRCLATGFTRLFCPIEEDVLSTDHLELSSFAPVERLTLAVMKGSHAKISLGNNQLRPAKQVKILLEQGHLNVTDVNLDFPIRVEYGSNCQFFGLAVPAGHSATRYHRFAGDLTTVYQGNTVNILPPCFRVINLPTVVPLLTRISTTTLDSDLSDEEGITRKPVVAETTIENQYQELASIVIDQFMLDSDFTNTTMKIDEVKYGLFQIKNGWALGALVLLIIIALIPLCLAVYYRVYCRQRRRSTWTPKHESHINPAFTISGGDRTDASVSSLQSCIDHSTQTTDNAIRI